MAAPHVAGAAALIRELHPTWTANQVASQLVNTALDRGAAGRDNYYGHGILDAAYAVGIPRPLSVQIFGPENVRPSSQCLWEADVSDGEPPYSYKWYRNDDLVSTNSFYWGYTGSQHFSLELEVQDSGTGSDSDVLYVVIDPNAMECSL